MIFKRFYLSFAVLSHNYGLAHCLSHSNLDYLLSLITKVEQNTFTTSAKHCVFCLISFLDFLDYTRIPGNVLMVI